MLHTKSELITSENSVAIMLILLSEGVLRISLPFKEYKYEFEKKLFFDSLRNEEKIFLLEKTKKE